MLATSVAEDIDIKSIEDGARTLLKDTVTVLLDFGGLEYMVIGGWCPVLRNSSGIRHPGTLDVDVLFRESYRSGQIADVVGGLIGAGFMPSAKHPFQLLKPQTIDGKSFVYNIDLLHPGMLDNKDQVGMFVDHLDLDVPISSHEAKTRKMMSIVLPNSNVLFSESLFGEFELEGLPFNLVSFDGMFITKMDSCQKQKRERDSFDIYVAFMSSGIDVGRLSALSKTDKRIEQSLLKFKEYLRNNAGEFNENCNRFARIAGSPAKTILQALG